ncbi:MAG TPA: mannose-1-phosphate guanylyltransferase [Chloroflexia bacterium]|nr:mannose-1-phosphate guanylyltransferase [Chloroflexia bacterium]
MYAIVLAGGIGSRLWPRSRNNSPKQLLNLVSDKTMIQETIGRLQQLMPVQNITIVVGENHAEQVREQLPELPKDNILIEPSGRGTAPAIGLGLAYIARLAEAAGDKDPVIGSFHADHVITKRDHFCEVVRAAARVAEDGYIVTLGITPDSPHTGYGYIERDGQIEEIDGLPVYQVARFVEKPPRSVAEEYLTTGRYSWNSGMFIWKLSVINEEYARYLPALSAQLKQLEEAYGKPDYNKVLASVWNEVRSETIDVGIAEKSQRMAVLPADIGWSDVGDWSVVADLIASQHHTEDGNAVVCNHMGLNTTNSLIYSTCEGKLVATIGLDNMVIVDLPDVLLVAERSQNQDVKKIVERLKKEGLEKFL